MTRAEKALAAVTALQVPVATALLGGVRGFHRPWRGSEPGGFEAFLWADGAFALVALLGAAGFALAGAVAAERRAAGEPHPLRPAVPLLLPLAGLIALAVLQLVPLPRAVLALLSPGTDRLLDAMVPGDDSWRPLSIAPWMTRREIEGLLLGTGALVGATLVSRHAAGSVAMVVTVIASFLGSAIYGLATTHLGDASLHGFARDRTLGVTGTFVNRSHFAAGCGAALASALGLLSLAVSQSWGRRVRRRAAVGALLAAAVICALAVSQSRSRMGLAGAAGAVAVLGILAAMASKGPAALRTAFAVLVVAVAALAAWWTAHEIPAMRRRFELGVTRDGFSDIRFPAWLATVRLATEYPVLGTGLGTFASAIHETQSADNPDELIHAHCEPLELLADGGIAGLALGVLLLAGAATACVRAVSIPNRRIRTIGCAAGAGLAAIVAMALVEFPLHVPAVALAAALLAGAAAGAAVPAKKGEDAGSPGRERAWRAGGLALAILLAAAAILGSRAASLRGAARRAEQSGDATAWLAAARRLVDAAPRDPFARRSLARATLLPLGGPGFEERIAASLREADAAVALEPGNAFGHFERARALAARGDAAEAAAALRRARARAGGIGHLHHAAGRLLLVLAASEPSLLPDALAAMREAANCDPGRLQPSLDALRNAGVPEEAWQEVIPPHPRGWTRYASILRSTGDVAGAARALARASILAPGNPELKERALAAGEDARIAKEIESMLDRAAGGGR